MVRYQKPWQPLSILGWSKCPTIFYRYRGDEDDLSLELALTDLVAEWKCSLDLGEIQNLAKKEKSSIDPSESHSQTKVLLQKLGQSLASGTNRLVRTSETKRQYLMLKTEIELPKPLKALRWTFKLEPQSTAVFADELLRPCLYEASLNKRKLDSLYSTIKTKDHVIAKLLDRIESSGIDMSLIFPGITSLKSRQGFVSAEEAKKHVPGLLEFSEPDWNLHIGGNDPKSLYGPSGLNNLIDGIRYCPSHTAENHDGWFMSLPTSFDKIQTTKVSSKTDTSLNEDTSNQIASDESTEGEEFERQPTPPQLKTQQREDKESNDGELSSPLSKRARLEPNSERSQNQKVTGRMISNTAHPKKRSDSTSSTATESASDIEDKSSTSWPNVRKLGRVGAARKSKTKSPSNSPSPSARPDNTNAPRRLGRIGNKSNDQTLTDSNSDTATESEADDDLDVKTSSRTSQKDPTVTKTGRKSETQKSVGRLGKLGYKKQESRSSDKDGENDDSGKFSRTDTNTSRLKDEATNQKSQSIKKQDTNLKSHNVTTDVHMTDEIAAAEEEETAEQKADRRRQELKQTLKKAPAARKKRKF